VYVPKKGFFPADIDPVFHQDEIPTEKIGSILHKHVRLLEKYLTGTKIHSGSIKPSYSLFLDEKDNLHLRCSVFVEGDLMHKNAAYFGHWVYLDKKGFYLLENPLFEGIEKVIPRVEMNDFINRHRAWLNGFEGFQTHVFAIESQLSYSVNKEGFLFFESI